MGDSLSIQYVTIGGYKMEIDSDGEITINIPRRHSDEKICFTPDELQRVVYTAQAFKNRCNLSHNK